MEFSDKYKDRKPEETIKLIEEFFTNRGYDIIKTPLDSGMNTYSYGIDLMYKGRYIYDSNGKGVNKTFALASGLGELYERFCNSCPYWYNFLINAKAIELNKDKGYTFRPDEKRLSPDDVIEDPYMNKFYFSTFKNDRDLWKKAVSSLHFGNIFATPYKNIFNENDVKWIVESIFEVGNGSNGSVAGNSYEEAFNEGFSELCEREVQNFFLTEKVEKLKVIRNSSITEPVLKSIIEKIEEKDNKVFVVDCWDWCQSPVAMVLILLKNEKRIVVNFGSFPIFEIAVERCFTEVMQNVEHFNINFGSLPQLPHRAFYRRSDAIHESFRSVSSNNILDESILDKIEYTDFPNENYISVKERSNNKFIYNYWEKYIKNKNLDVYVCDNSHCEELKALRIMIYNRPALFHDCASCNNFTKQSFNASIPFYEQTSSLIKTITGEYNFDYFNRVLNGFLLKNIDNAKAACSTVFFIQSILLPNFNTFEYDSIPNEVKHCLDDDFYVANTNFDLFDNLINRFSFITRYKRADYSFEEIKKILSSFDDTITMEEYENSDNADYVLEHAVYKPLWEYYHSDDFKNYVQGMLCYGLDPYNKKDSK